MNRIAFAAAALAGRRRRIVGRRFGTIRRRCGRLLVRLRLVLLPILRLAALRTRLRIHLYHRSALLPAGFVALGVESIEHERDDEDHADECRGNL